MARPKNTNTLTAAERMEQSLDALAAADRRMDLARTAFVPEAERKANIDRMVAYIATKAADQLPLHQLAQPEFNPAGGVGLERLNPLALACLIDPAAVKQAVARLISDRLAGHDGQEIPEAMRAAAFAEITEEIAGHWREYVAACRELEAAGRRVEWHPGVDPMAYLGLSAEDLPVPHGWTSPEAERAVNDADAARAVVGAATDRVRDARDNLRAAEKVFRSFEDEGRQVPSGAAQDVPLAQKRLELARQALESATRNAEAPIALAGRLEEFLAANRRNGGYCMSPAEWEYERTRQS
ncbi:MAG: hypothetical protein IH614_11715, partial [Desulfuromonadales bacterium]|nr:hypothetical protein [Desulfuromonadales bacterium]